MGGKSTDSAESFCDLKCSKINLFRILTTSVLLGICVAGSCLIYALLTNQENETADNEFLSYKRHFETSIEDNIDYQIRATVSTSDIYREACPTDAHWPLCSIDDAFMTDITDHLHGGDGVAVGVFISPEERGLVEDDFYARYADIDTGNSSFGKGIFGLNKSIGGDFKYPIINGSFGIRRLAPVTQMTKPHLFARFIGLYDEYSEIMRFRALNELLNLSITCDQKHAVTVMSEIITFPEIILNPPNPDGSDVVIPPKSLLFTAVSPKKSNSTAARGYILKPFVWSEIFSGILPSNIPGLHVVLHINERAYKFVVNDGKTFFSKAWYSSEGKGYHIAMFDGSSQYYVQLGRSSEFDDHYRSKTPLVAVVSFVAMIVVISVVFFWYDQFVNKQILRKEIILQTKQLFVRYISHEIRTPLNTVCIGIGLVFEEIRSALQKEEFTPEQMEMMRHWHDVVFSVSESSASAVQVLNDLLDYEQIEISKLNMDVSVFSPYGAVESVFRSFEYQMGAKGIVSHLTMDVFDSIAETSALGTIGAASMGVSTTTMSSVEAHSADLSVEAPVDKSRIAVEGDCKKIEQVIRNFLSNAIKFTPNGGCISMDVRWVKRPQIPKRRTSRGRMQFSDGFIRVCCKDSGVGLNSEQLGKLFAEGVQFDANRLQDGKGSGLGLMICKGIIEEHKGYIHAESEGSGRGCSFIFELPVTCDEKLTPYMKKTSFNAPTLTSDGVSNDSLRVPETKPKRILLCDDSVASVKLVQRLLMKSGYEVEVSYHGGECLEKLEHKNYHENCDLVLIDNHMPFMTGPEAVKIMRKRGYTPLIVGLTGSVTKDELDEFQSAGCDHVLGKPLQISELEAIIATAVFSRDCKAL